MMMLIDLNIKKHGDLVHGYLNLRKKRSKQPGRPAEVLHRETEAVAKTEESPEKHGGIYGLVTANLMIHDGFSRCHWGDS